MIQLTQRDHDHFVRIIQALVLNAPETGVREIPVRNSQTGAQIATLLLHDLPKRPKDMPRALRPKQKLSKRQRDAAKRAKRGEKVAA